MYLNSLPKPMPGVRILRSNIDETEYLLSKVPLLMIWGTELFYHILEGGLKLIVPKNHEDTGDIWKDI